MKKGSRTLIGLSLAVTLCGGFIYFDRNSTTSEELEARRRSVFKTFHRERVSRIDIDHPSGRYELQKRGADWFVLKNNVARKADVMEVEHALGEIEGAEATRTPGAVTGDSRARFGLDHPRATVVVYEGTTAALRFVVGGAVSGEEATYVEFEGSAVVLPKSFADAFDRASTDLRDKAIADIDGARIQALELAVGADRRVIQREGFVWRMTEPAQGRASRGAVEAITTELRELRAARVLEDDVNDAGLARYGLASPAVRLTVRRGTTEPMVLRVGSDCVGHEGEVAATREGTGTVVCLARSFVDALRVTPETLRDDHLVVSRTDEISTIRVRGAVGQTADLVVRRDGEHWFEGEAPAGDAGSAGAMVDGEAVESWLNTLHDLNAAARLPDDSRAAHGLSPSAMTIEIARTGVEGREVIHVGASDEGGLYVSRDDEPIVLQFAPSVAETLRVEPIRFHARSMIHDVEGDLAALVLEAGTFREDLQKLDGAWRVVRPATTPADGAMLIDAARQLAGLDVDRWISTAPRPEHGFATPRARVIARFEGRGPSSDGGTDAAVARVRSYTLLLGALTPGGGIYAMLEGGSGVGVVPRSLVDGLITPHLDRSVLHVASDDVTGVVITQPASRVEFVRDGARWRTAAGAPIETSRVEELLERLNNLIVSRVHAYGPPSTSAGLGAFTLDVRRGGDAGASTLHYTFGESTGGEPAATYVRRDDVDATMSVPSDFAEALRSFRP